ncbi:Glutathione transport system permease protein GsiD [Firmicutes bacterium ASF500]|nr:Glutathione transport system permease protein GsiD [Firmicutes bacterium ASF500]
MKKTKHEAPRTDKKRSQLLEVWGRLKKSKVAIAGLVILTLLILMAVFADVLVDYELAIAQNMPEKLQGPSPAHWLGTDGFGRDILARIIHGSRISLSIGFVSVIVSLAVGGAIGSIAGYYGGTLDMIVMRFIDVLMAIPSMLMCICVVTVLGPGMSNLLVAITISYVATFCVIVRSSILTIKNSDYIEAARATGVGTFRIILKHIIPNTMGPIMVQATLSIGSVILSAAGLSFVGLGVMPPTPEWGAILTEGKEFIRTAPHIVLFPGIAIMLAVMSLNFLGDGLRDALDPRLKQ